MRSDSNQIVLEAWLSLGQRSQSESGLNPERVYLQALAWSERMFGKSSPQSGRILIALMDLYDKQERHADSHLVEERIRSILVASIDAIYPASANRARPKGSSNLRDAT